MSVTVRIPSALRKLTNGQSELTGEGLTVRELLDDLGRENPGLLGRLTGDDGEIRQFLNVFVNGSDVRFEDNLDTPVQAGDEVSIVPSIAGGTGLASVGAVRT
jgi:molybdopterin synthase sulfur carrier subunit